MRDGKVYPSIKGSAFVNAEAELVLDPRDPLLHGHSGMNKDAYDVVIVGAGIVGAACADEFARRGMRVAVVDQDMIGGGATAAGMGHIVDHGRLRRAVCANALLPAALARDCALSCRWMSSTSSVAPFGLQPTKKKWQKFGASEITTAAGSS